MLPVFLLKMLNNKNKKKYKKKKVINLVRYRPSFSNKVEANSDLVREQGISNHK